MLNTLHLFAGAGGGILADLMLGHRPIGAIEIEAYPRKVLLARQLDGSLPQFPIWDDVTTFRADNPNCSNYIARLKSLQNLCISGGFPCQDISAAGKGAGITGERSGLWSEFARIIGEIMPRYVFVENSPMLTVRGLGTVLKDLAKMGFDAEWGVLSATDLGANHKRDRIWILAKRRDVFSYTEHNGNGRRQQLTQSTQKEIESRNTKRQLADTDLRGCDDGQNEVVATKARLNAQRELSAGGANMVNTNLPRCKKQWWRKSISENKQWQTKRPAIECSGWWRTEPNVGRVVNGCAFRVDRLKALGNAQVPLCAATAFRLLAKRLETHSPQLFT